MLRSVFAALLNAACILSTNLVIATAAPAAPAAELGVQEGLKDSIRIAWIRRNYGLLDALADEWRTKKSRTPNGFWNLSLLYNHLDENFLAQNPVLYPSGFDWQAINQWIGEKPASPTPIILKALMLIRQAQDCNVPLRAARVTRKAPEAFKPDFLKAARNLLEEHKELASRDPHWYVALLRVIRLQGANDDELLLAHAEALAAHPLYYQAHFEVFRELITRWYPNVKLIDGFANTVLEGTKQLEGHRVYARLYEDATIELNQGRFFAPSRAVWDRMRTGYEEITTSYPTEWNAHHYAFNACMADDVTALKRLFASFKGPPVREAWQSTEVYQQCRALTAP